jgi:hypothetical protein
LVLIEFPTHRRGFDEMQGVQEIGLTGFVLANQARDRIIDRDNSRVKDVSESLDLEGD